MSFLAACPASLSPWVFSALPAVRPCVVAVAASHCWQHINVRTEHGMATTKHLESTVAAWLGGIWAHRNSSWCSSDVGMRVRNLGYFWNQWRPTVSLASRSRSSTCHRSSLINMRLGKTPEVFRGASSWACTLVSWVHFIQLNRGMAVKADSPENWTNKNDLLFRAMKPWLPHSTVNTFEYVGIYVASNQVLISLLSCNYKWQKSIRPCDELPKGRCNKNMREKCDKILRL